MSKHNKAPNYKRRQTVAAGLLGLTAAAGLVGLVKINERSDNNARENYVKAERALIDNISTARKSTIVLAENATYYSEPKKVDESLGVPTTVSGKVPKGKSIVIINAPQAIDEQSGHWIAFSFEQNGDKAENTADPDKLLWANIDDLISEGDANSPLIAEFNEPNSVDTVEAGANTISIDINEAEQRFTASGKDGGPAIGVAEIMTNQDVIEFLDARQSAVVG
jgi:hypothetical protein